MRVHRESKKGAKSLKEKRNKITTDIKNKTFMVLRLNIHKI